MDEKQQALVAHRDLQAGLRAREELISTFRLKKNKEVDRVEHLKEEHRALDKMLFRMMFFLKVQYNLYLKHSYSFFLFHNFFF